MLAYTIAPAVESGVFASVIVSTDSEETAAIARHYGAEVPFLRPAEFSGDTSPDIEWIEYTLTELQRAGRDLGCFSLLRPTSPFRNADTIRRAWRQFVRRRGVDSLRAVEKCGQHPGKMWVVRGERMLPLLSPAAKATSGVAPTQQPWHSTPYQALPPVFVQNASLEIAWTRVVFETRTIAGDVLMPFITEGHEGFDINDPTDWMVAERLLADGASPPARGCRAGLRRRENSTKWVTFRPTRAKRSSFGSCRCPQFERCAPRPGPAARTRAFAALARINALSMIAGAWSGHIGTSFSSLEIISWLFLNELRARPGARRLRHLLLVEGPRRPGLYRAHRPGAAAAGAVVSAAAPARPARATRRRDAVHPGEHRLARDGHLQGEGDGAGQPAGRAGRAASSS